ncbi:MAG: hypothetical protein ACFN4W_04710 [Segatella oris]
MKKNISFKWEGGSSLTREQLKHVVGGSGSGCSYEGQYCTWHGKSGRCQYLPFSGGLVCWCG